MTTPNEELQARLLAAWKDGRIVNMPKPGEPGKRVVGYVIEWDESFPMLPGAIIAALATPTPQAAGVSEAVVDSVRADITSRAADDGHTHIALKDEWVRAALEAVWPTAAGAAPEGFVLVPRIPTREMWAAANSGNCWEDAYAKMLAAAPQPGAQHGQEGREVMRDDAAFNGRIGRLSLPTGEGAAHD